MGEGAGEAGLVGIPIFVETGGSDWEGFLIQAIFMVSGAIISALAGYAVSVANQVRAKKRAEILVVSEVQDIKDWAREACKTYSISWKSAKYADYKLKAGEKISKDLEFPFHEPMLLLGIEENASIYLAGKDYRYRLWLRQLIKKYYKCSKSCELAENEPLPSESSDEIQCTEV